MTTLKSVLAAIGVAILMVLGAFGVGRFRGREQAEEKADRQRTEEKAAAIESVAERRVEATKRPAMYSRMLTACLMTMLIASCVTRGIVPVVVDTACDWGEAKST